MLPVGLPASSFPNSLDQGTVKLPLPRYKAFSLLCGPCSLFINTGSPDGGCLPGTAFACSHLIGLRLLPPSTGSLFLQADAQCLLNTSWVPRWPLEEGSDSEVWTLPAS